jgi:F-type H+-transporting ATPase subunit a
VEETRRWRWGVNRWFILLFIILSVFAARAYSPILPHVQLPAEELTGTLFTLPIFGDFALTNTLVGIILADVLLLLLGFAVYRAVKRGDMVLTGVVGAVEAILEGLYTLTETTAGKWAKSIFPYMATIFLLVLAVNWMELIPGVDSIGLLHHSEEGFPTQEIAQVGSLPILAIVKDGGTGEAEEAEHAEAGEEVAAHEDELFSVVPFVRVTSTDLNFTLALALVSVMMTQVFGVRALGMSYFTKFLNVKSLFTNPFFGAINFGVGLLELVSEFSKILSFSFRLFGNIFAGSVLLFVIGSLVPVFAQTIFLLLEFFVGMIQAIVFGMLTMVFMSQATASHDHEEGEH